MTTAAVVTLVVRYGLVLLFLPFSALDKIFGFDHAVNQAQSVFKPRPIAIAMILIGLFVELICTLSVVTQHCRSGSRIRHCGLLRGDGGPSTSGFGARAIFWSEPDGRGPYAAVGLPKEFVACAAGFLLIVAARTERGSPFSPFPLCLQPPLRSSP